MLLFLFRKTLQTVKKKRKTPWQWSICCNPKHLNHLKGLLMHFCEVFIPNHWATYEQLKVYTAATPVAGAAEEKHCWPRPLWCFLLELISNLVHELAAIRFHDRTNNNPAASHPVFVNAVVAQRGCSITLWHRRGFLQLRPTQHFCWVTPNSGGNNAIMSRCGEKVVSLSFFIYGSTPVYAKCCSVFLHIW